MKSRIFFCLQCSKGSLLRDEITCDCKPQFKVEGIIKIELKRTRWGRFTHWFYSLDIGYWLAFMGGAIINTILLPHFNLSFSASMLESFCFGCLLIGLLRERK